MNTLKREFQMLNKQAVIAEYETDTPQWVSVAIDHNITLASIVDDDAPNGFWYAVRGDAGVTYFTSMKRAVQLTERLLDYELNLSPVAVRTALLG